MKYDSFSASGLVPFSRLVPRPRCCFFVVFIPRPSPSLSVCALSLHVFWRASVVSSRRRYLRRASSALVCTRDGSSRFCSTSNPDQSGGSRSSLSASPPLSFCDARRQTHDPSGTSGAFKAQPTHEADSIATSELPRERQELLKQVVVAMVAILHHQFRVSAARFPHPRVPFSPPPSFPALPPPFPFLPSLPFRLVVPFHRSTASTTVCTVY